MIISSATSGLFFNASSCHRTFSRLICTLGAIFIAVPNRDSHSSKYLSSSSSILISLSFITYILSLYLPAVWCGHFRLHSLFFLQQRKEKSLFLEISPQPSSSALRDCASVDFPRASICVHLCKPPEWGASVVSILKTPAPSISCFHPPCPDPCPAAPARTSHRSAASGRGWAWRRPNRG